MLGTLRGLLAVGVVLAAFTNVALADDPPRAAPSTPQDLMMGGFPESNVPGTDAPLYESFRANSVGEILNQARKAAERCDAAELARLRAILEAVKAQLIRQGTLPTEAPDRQARARVEASSLQGILDRHFPTLPPNCQPKPPVVEPPRTQVDTLPDCIKNDPAVRWAEAKRDQDQRNLDRSTRAVTDAVPAGAQGPFTSHQAAVLLDQAGNKAARDKAEQDLRDAIRAAEAKNCPPGTKTGMVPGGPGGQADGQHAGVPGSVPGDPASTPVTYRNPLFDIAIVFAGYHPSGSRFSVTGVDTLAGDGAVDPRFGGGSTPYHSLGLRLRLYQYATLLALHDIGFFGEIGYQHFFGRAFQNAFSHMNGFPQGFGEQVYRANWAWSFMLGVALPIGLSPFGRMTERAALDGHGGGEAAACVATCALPGRVMLDIYGGISLTNYTHTLQGNEAGGGAGALGFFAQANRTNVDPVVGVGVRVPFSIGDSGPAMFFGLNAELAWRAGSVLVAQSRNFPSQTYWGTIEKSLDLSASVRLGISF